MFRQCPAFAKLSSTPILFLLWLQTQHLCSAAIALVNTTAASLTLQRHTHPEPSSNFRPDAAQIIDYPVHGTM